MYLVTQYHQEFLSNCIFNRKGKNKTGVHEQESMV